MLLNLIDNSIKHFVWTLPSVSEDIRYISITNCFEIKVNENTLYNLLIVLKNHSIYDMSQLTDFFAYDVPGKTKRFVFLYYLRSLSFNSQILLKFYVEELAFIESLCSVFSSIDWLEREVWDMYGVFFLKHGSLKRILTDYNFKGHPLRKDFPMTGFKEIYYDDVVKRIVFVKVELAQEYRNFKLHTTWTNSDFSVVDDNKELEENFFDKV